MQKQKTTNKQTKTTKQQQKQQKQRKKKERKPRSLRWSTENSIILVNFSRWVGRKISINNNNKNKQKNKPKKKKRPMSFLYWWSPSVQSNRKKSLLTRGFLNLSSNLFYLQVEPGTVFILETDNPSSNPTLKIRQNCPSKMKTVPFSN